MLKRTDSRGSIHSPEPVVMGRYAPPSADQSIIRQSPERPYERLQSPNQQPPQSVLVPQYQRMPPQSFAQPLEINRPAEPRPTNLDLNRPPLPQQQQQPYTPVGLNNLITPTRNTPSTPGQVTFRLPEEVERRNNFNSKFDPRQQQRTVTTPTSESFRRYNVPATPEYEAPRRSNWGRSKSADRRYRKPFWYCKKFFLKDGPLPSK